MAEKFSLTDLGDMTARGERITMLTAYDAPSARLAETAGVEILLIGDSVAMTMLGHDSTVSVTVDEMLLLTRAVARGAKRPLIVVDMPFGSFQVSDESAIEHAIRFIKEGGADAVKVEGAGPTSSRARSLTDAGIAVMGHIGLTPQSATLLGGLKAQGRNAVAALRLVDDALALERAGCFALVLEAIPAQVAAAITGALEIPTIGIGAGPSCDGQVLVWHDVLGLTTGHVPKFVKPYADLAGTILAAVTAFVADVRAGTFPQAQHTYAMPEEERRVFEAALTGRAKRQRPQARSRPQRTKGGTRT